MKYLLLIISLSIFGCDSKKEDFIPQYSLGDHVRMLGFYKSCVGIVIDYRKPDELNENKAYNLVMTCSDTTATLWVRYSDIAERIED